MRKTIIKRLKTRRIINFIALVIVFFGFLFNFNQINKAHRFHTSLTRIDYNADQKIIEITVQLFTHDLKQVLEERSGKSIELEKTKGTDQIIFAYLKENFALADAKDELKTLKWIGKELENDSVRIYLETDSASNLENFFLKNTIFLDNFPEQTNIVVCRYDGKKADLLYKSGDKVKKITENKPPAEK